MYADLVEKFEPEIREEEDDLQRARQHHMDPRTARNASLFSLVVVLVPTLPLTVFVVVVVVAAVGIAPIPVVAASAPVAGTPPAVTGIPFGVFLIVIIPAPVLAACKRKKSMDQ